MKTMTKKLDYLRLCIFCALYAVFYAVCLYKNYSGLSFPFFAAGTLCFYIYFLRAQGYTLKPFSIFYMISIILLGADVCITASPILTDFNWCFIFVLFFMLFLHNAYDDSTWDVTRYFNAIVSTVFSSLQFLLSPIVDGLRAKTPQNDTNVTLNMTSENMNMTVDGSKMTDHSGNMTNMSENATDIENTEGIASKDTHPIMYILLGLAISVPILAVVLPLLMSSDMVFSNTLKSIFKLNFEDVFGVLFVIIVMFFVSYMFSKRLMENMESLSAPVADKRSLNPIITITINTVLLLIYVLYCAIQIKYLFMHIGNLPDGYTYTKYAHEGFFQLVFVCLINIILVLICRKYSRDNTLLKILLCALSVCTYIMIFSSAYRMALYIGAYRLTFLRLYVLWALIVMGVIIAGIIAYIFIPDMPFVKYAIVTFISLWIVFIYIRPDYRIAKYNITYHNEDSYYLTRLSADAALAVVKYSDDSEFIESYLETMLKKQECKYVYEFGEDLPVYVEYGIRDFNYSKWKLETLGKEYGIRFYPN